MKSSTSEAGGGAERRLRREAERAKRRGRSEESEAGCFPHLSSPIWGRDRAVRVFSIRIAGERWGVNQIDIVLLPNARGTAWRKSSPSASPVNAEVQVRSTGFLPQMGEDRWGRGCQRICPRPQRRALRAAQDFAVGRDQDVSGAVPARRFCARARRLASRSLSRRASMRARRSCSRVFWFSHAALRLACSLSSRS